MTVEEFAMTNPEGGRLNLPKGSEIIDVIYGSGTLILVVLVDSSTSEREERFVQSFKPGEFMLPGPESVNYIGHFKLPRQSRRYLFEILNKRKEGG